MMICHLSSVLFNELGAIHLRCDALPPVCKVPVKCPQQEGDDVILQEQEQAHGDYRQASSSCFHCKLSEELLLIARVSCDVCCMA